MSFGGVRFLIPDSLLLEFLAKSFHGLLCSGSKGWQGIQSGLILAQLPNKTNLSLSEPPVQQYIILQAAKSIKLQLAKRLRRWNIKRNHQLPSKGSQTSGFKLRFYLPTTTIFYVNVNVGRMHRKVQLSTNFQFQLSFKM